MLADVLVTVKDTESLRFSVVVSTDRKVHKFAENFEAIPIAESQPGLNQAVSEAVQWCIQHGAVSALILPADIPLITPRVLSRIISVGQRVSVVISPSRNGNGTNALLLKPPDAISTFYGIQSFQLHIQEVLAKGLDFQTFKSPKLALDIDTAEDLRDLVKLDAKETYAHRFLVKSKIIRRLRVHQEIRTQNE